jgi:hypothetical protein
LNKSSNIILLIYDLLKIFYLRRITNSAPVVSFS